MLRNLGLQKKDSFFDGLFFEVIQNIQDVLLNWMNLRKYESIFNYFVLKYMYSD